MLPDKKICAFDVDGTLTVSKSPITQQMADLVKSLMKQKIVVAISGGKFGQFKTQFLPPFDGDSSVLPFIHNLILLPTSGSQRYEYDEVKKDWQLTDKNPLEEKTKEKAIKLLKEIIASGKYEIPPNPKGEIIEDRDTQITFSGCGQLATVEEKTLWDGDQRKRKKIKEVLEPELPDATILINAYSSIDILPKGFNKAVGLGILLKKLNLEKSDMIFIGDGLFPGGNDYSVHEAGIENIPVKGPEDTAEIIKQWVG